MKLLKISSIAIWLLGNSLILTGQEATDLEGTSIIQDTICQAAFSSAPDSLTSFPFYYHFMDLSTGNINEWYWDFGDGFFSTEKNPSHQYSEAGTYHVCLTASDINDPAGCSDQDC
jgi:PKD repeat protein